MNDMTTAFLLGGLFGVFFGFVIVAAAVEILYSRSNKLSKQAERLAERGKREK